jgi:hypothetical protein
MTKRWTPTCELREVLWPASAVEGRRWDDRKNAWVSDTVYIENHVIQQKWVRGSEEQWRSLPSVGGLEMERQAKDNSEIEPLATYRLPSSAKP